MEHVCNLIEALAPKLEHMVGTKTIVGDPIEVHGKTLIPLMRASYGVFGGGVVGQGEGAARGKGATQGSGKGEGKGGGTGGGVKLSPAAIICIDDAGVSVFPIDESKGLADVIAEAVPQIIAKDKASDAPEADPADGGEETEG